MKVRRAAVKAAVSGLVAWLAASGCKANETPGARGQAAASADPAGRLDAAVLASPWPPPGLAPDVASLVRRTDRDTLGDPAVGYVVDRALVSRVACEPGVALGKTTLKDAAPGAPGVTLATDDPASLVYALGLRSGDRIEQLGMTPVASRAAVLAVLLGPSALHATVVRGDTRLFIPIDTTGTSKAIAADERARIRRVGAAEVHVARSLLAELAANPARLVCSVRVVNEGGDGGAWVRAFGVRPDTLLGQLGLENGDRIDKVAGVAVVTVEDAARGLDAAGRAGDAFDVVLQRRMQPLTLSYRVDL